MSDLTKIPLEDGFKTTLSQKLTTAGLTMYVGAVPNFTFPASVTTYAVIEPKKSNMEIVEITAYDSSALTITIAASGRGLNRGATYDPGAKEHAVGSVVQISDNYQFWADIQTAIASKVDADIDNVIAANITFTADDETVSFKVPNMTTTARDLIASPANGMMIYNTTVGAQQVYDGGAWASLDTGASVPNASTTVAGVVEEATTTEMGASTATGDTGARLFVNSGNLVKTSSGAGDENKVAVLDASGQFASGFVNLGAAVTSAQFDELIFGDGSDGALSTSGDVNLARDMYYSSVTVATGDTVFTNGYKVYCTGTLDCDGTGKLSASGAVGGVGGNASGGSAGTAGAAGAAAYTQGTVPLSVAGGAGGAGGAASQNGNAGSVNAETIKPYNNADGPAGGAGGTANFAGGAGGNVTNSGTGENIQTILKATDLSMTKAGNTSYLPVASLGAGGGGGGGSDGAGTAGGGGGGGGGSGGMIWVAAKTIDVLVAECTGANGGNGGNGSGGGGGGGGGAGGNGGVVVAIYDAKTTVTATVTGGTGGSVGTGQTPVAGANGNAGKSFEIEI